MRQHSLAAGVFLLLSGAWLAGCVPQTPPSAAAQEAGPEDQAKWSAIYPDAIDPDLKSALVRMKLGKGKIKVAAARAIIEKKAADGDPWAIRYLADSYMSGTKTFPQNTVKALGYYEILAGRGDRQAMLRIAGTLSAGKTTVKDPEQALHYLKMAASAGDASAALQVAKTFEAAKGPERDLARDWYVLAALLGNKPAREWLTQHP